MKKSLVLGLLVVSVGLLWADGSFVSAPGPVVAATGQNYYYPAAASPAAGGQLINDGNLTFRWSNTAVTSTTSLTVLQFPAFPSATIAQINALTPAAAGQVVFCSNCTRAPLCVSTGTASTQWAIVGSTGSLTTTVCQ